MKLRELLLQYEIQNGLSHKEAADMIGVSSSTYYRWMRGESTQIKRKNINRLSELFDCDIELIIDENESVKPILGRVKAGYDLWADQDIEGYIELGQEDTRKGDYFLRVTGDSMEGSHIFDGDIVYVQQCNEVDSGNIAVVLIGEEATIKKVYFKKDLMVLESTNPRYETRYFTPEEVEELPVRVIGLVRFVRTDFV